MKFSKVSQLFLVSIIGLVVASLLTACQIVTIDYLFGQFHWHCDIRCGLRIGRNPRWGTNRVVRRI